MRLRVCLENPAGVRLPISYQEHLTAAAYGLLAASDADYAQRLHDEGYRSEGYGSEGGRRFKLFTFSWLRGPRRAVEGGKREGGSLRLAPGPVEWLISSPVNEFLTHLAGGLLSQGVLRVGAATLPICQVEMLPAPLFSEIAFTDTVRFSCLSPIVAALSLPDGRTRYLRPSDEAEFGEAVRRNLLRKHALLYGGPPADDRFALTFDPAYLARSHGGTKLITYKNIGIVGAFCPFTVSGSTDLIRVGYEAGFGEKNAGGFGMVEMI